MLGDRQILKLLIQPLVENAIYHGIKNKEGPGQLRITAALEGDAVCVRICDNGVGMPAGQLQALNTGTIEPSRTNGVGVRNVQERIRLSYGSDYGVRFESVPGEGTTAIIRIPLAAEQP